MNEKRNNFSFWMLERRREEKNNSFFFLFSLLFFLIIVFIQFSFYNFMVIALILLALFVSFGKKKNKKKETFFRNIFFGKRRKHEKSYNTNTHIFLPMNCFNKQKLNATTKFHLSVSTTKKTQIFKQICWKHQYSNWANIMLKMDFTRNEISTT